MKLYKIRRKKMNSKKMFYITIPTELARRWLDHGAYVEIVPLQDNPLAAIVRVVKYEELPKVMSEE
jgi:hypothetical protein